MAMTVHCDIVSAERQLFSGLVEIDRKSVV